MSDIAQLQEELRVAYARIAELEAAGGGTRAASVSTQHAPAASTQHAAAPKSDDKEKK